jgi:hypothetical protein
MAKLNTTTSIVDYLKSKGKDSSMGARTKLAGNYGIKGYKGTANQNVNLLKAVSRATSKPTTTPAKATPKPVAQTTAKPAVQTMATPKATATTTAAKTTATAKPSSAIEEQDGIMKDSYDEYKDFLKNSSDSFYDGQKAMLDKAKAERLAELEKAYNQAVQDGEMSQEEAEKQLAEETEQINQGAYQQSQVTDLSAQTRGIQNSQQLLAMQSGDMRATNELKSEARTARDERINQIKDRLSQITNNYNLDKSTTNTAYNSDLANARAQADMQYSQGMTNMTMAQYKSALEMKNNLTMQEQAQLDMLERMETQQGYDLRKMSLQNDYTLNQMKTGQKYDLEKMAKAFGYDLDKMSRQQVYQLEQMAKNFGYDKQLNQQSHDFDMEKMAQQYLNQSSLMTKQQNFDMKKMGAAFQQDMKKMEAEYGMKFEYDEKRLASDIAAEQQAYEKSRQRLAAQYKEGTPEYNIRLSQLKDARDQAINQLHAQTMYEATVKAFGKNPSGNGYNQFMQDPNGYMFP